MTNWIGNLLARVIDHCVTAGTPQLGALCVKEDGTVGEGYRHAVLASGSTIDELNLDQLDDHAAKMRLECYRHFGAELPRRRGSDSDAKGKGDSGSEKYAEETRGAAQDLSNVLAAAASHGQMRRLRVVASVSNEGRSPD